MTVQEAHVAVVGLLPDEFDDIRLMTSQAILLTSLSLVTSRRRRHNMTLRDVTDDVSVTPGVVAHSCAERFVRRSRRPVERRLWRRLSGKSRQRGRSWTSSSRVQNLEAGVNRVLRAAAHDDEFVLIVESTDAAYVTSRPPGCRLIVSHQTTPLAQYRFVIAASNLSSSWQRGLLQQLDSAVSALQQTNVMKRLYYKWWTSTDCLSYFTDPNIWTSSLNRDTTDIDETSDDERIFLSSPVLATRGTERPPYSTTSHTAVSTRVSDDELDDGDVVAELDEQGVVSQQRPVTDVSTGQQSYRQRHRHSDVNVSSTTTPVTSAANLTTTTVSTTTRLARRSQRQPHNNDRESSSADERLATHDDFQLVVSTDGVIEPDQFDWVFVTNGALTGRLQDDYRLSFEDDNRQLVASEQEMAAKEHWPRGNRQSVLTRTSSASDSGQMMVVTVASINDGAVPRPTTVIITSLLLAASIT